MRLTMFGVPRIVEALQRLEAKAGVPLRLFDAVTIPPQPGTQIQAVVNGVTYSDVFGKWTPTDASILEGIMLREGFKPRLIWVRPSPEGADL